eukprot:561310-Pleurochrysis_carterae.AAC.1
MALYLRNSGFGLFRARHFARVCVCVPFCSCDQMYEAEQTAWGLSLPTRVTGASGARPPPALGRGKH